MYYYVIYLQVESIIFVFMENRIKEIAKKKGRSQAQIAEAAGAAVVTIAKYYTQDRQPSTVNLDKISTFLNCDPLELLEPGPYYAHFYDPQTGEWLGIRKK